VCLVVTVMRRSGLLAGACRYHAGVTGQAENEYAIRSRNAADRGKESATAARREVGSESVAISREGLGWDVSWIRRSTTNKCLELGARNANSGRRRGTNALFAEHGQVYCTEDLPDWQGTWLARLIE
jgi:hypothetical protein